MADVTLSSIIGHPRRRAFICTASAAYGIPTWAQGGKGIVYVTGIGGGGGGGTAGNTWGGSGAIARRCPFIIPSGITTLTVAIGAGGSGGAGGATTLTMNSVQYLSLGGGGYGGTSVNYGGHGGTPTIMGKSPYIDAASMTSSTSAVTQQGIVTVINQIRSAGGYPPVTAGMYGNFTGGANYADAATNKAGGLPFLGSYGLGGAQNQAGQPGILMLEYEEGF